MKTRTGIFLIVISIVLAGELHKVDSQDIQTSQIEANVPDEKVFDSILKRDLEKFFSNMSRGKTEVSYELLRKAPTQAGVAYPKFYLWVTAKKDGKVIHEGAIRVAAIERKEFEITDYLSKEDIRRSSGTLKKIFPQVLCEKILAKAYE